MPEPTMVSEIEITRVYEVLCDDHGVVDAPKTYREAIAARRLHFERDHPDAAAAPGGPGRGETDEQAGGAA